MYLPLVVAERGAAIGGAPRSSFAGCLYDDRWSLRDVPCSRPPFFCLTLAVVRLEFKYRVPERPGLAWVKTFAGF